VRLSRSAARVLVDDARALEATGCFAIVLEAVPGEVGATAVSAYVDDVRARRFPSDERCYRLEATELDRVYSLLVSDG
jgi:ketopantoate hydroxymethyltransferase